MGPMSNRNGQTHAKCREKEACTGPGCRIRTGKTDEKRGTK